MKDRDLKITPRKIFLAKYNLEQLLELLQYDPYNHYILYCINNYEVYRGLLSTVIPLVEDTLLDEFVYYLKEYVVEDALSIAVKENSHKAYAVKSIIRKNMLYEIIIGVNANVRKIYPCYEGCSPFEISSELITGGNVDNAIKIVTKEILDKISPP